MGCRGQAGGHAQAERGHVERRSVNFYAAVHPRSGHGPVSAHLLGIPAQSLYPRHERATDL